MLSLEGGGWGEMLGRSIGLGFEGNVVMRWMNA